MLSSHFKKDQNKKDVIISEEITGNKFSSYSEATTIATALPYRAKFFNFATFFLIIEFSFIAEVAEHGFVITSPLQVGRVDLKRNQLFCIKNC